MPTKTKKTESTKGGMFSTHLTRSLHHRIIGGVAGGIADFFHIDPFFIRLAFILSSIFGGSGVIIYLVLWLVLPSSKDAEPFTKESIEENVSDIKQKAEFLTQHFKKPHSNESKWNWGLVILIIGILLLLNNTGLFYIFHSHILWPLFFIGIGVYLLLKK